MPGGDSPTSFFPLQRRDFWLDASTEAKPNRMWRGNEIQGLRITAFQGEVAWNERPPCVTQLG